jgi:acetyl-CoA C-acetyltransferase
MAQIAPVYIVSAARTPIGNFQGSLASLAAPRLGAIAIQGALAQAKIDAAAIDEVFLGNVLTAGIGQAPARQAAIFAGLANTIPAVTVGKVCGSGMQAIVFAAKSILLGDADVVVAGGMESMSNVPYYLDKARSGYRMGNGTLVDGMIFDGLWDPYSNVHMGNCGDKCAAEYNFSREDQDRFAAESYKAAQDAWKSGAFDAEVVPVEIAQKKGDALKITQDEGPGKGGDLAKMATLRAAFSKDGTITAANASPLNDGASALILMSEAGLKKTGATPIAKLTGYATAAQAPEWFTTAPAKAMKNLFEKTGLSASDVDLFEINEAFAVVAMACAKIIEIPREKVNVHGGAVALGHPIGSSGSRIVTTLAHALARHGKKRGVASICIGGGEALAVSIERV